MKSAKHRRSLASAALASVLCAAPGSGAFYMPLPVTDFAAQAQAGQLLKTAKTMLVMAASMQQTLESIEAIVDGGFIGILSQVPLPGGWLVDAGRTAILTGKVPYTALASGLLNVSELPAGQTNLIARAIDGLSKGTTPLEIAKNIGLSSIDFSSLSAGEQAMAQTFVTIAGEGNPDARIAAVARLAQSHAMGATGELLAQSDTPDWVKNAVATGSSNEIWKSGDNATAWARNLAARQAAEPARALIGSAANRLHPSLMETLNGGQLIENVLAGRDSPPVGSVVWSAGVRTARSALETETKDGPSPAAQLAMNAMENLDPNAPARTRAQMGPSDVLTMLNEAAQTGAFDGHIEMETIYERNENAAEERRGENVTRKMLGKNELAMVGVTNNAAYVHTISSVAGTIAEWTVDAQNAHQNVKAITERHKARILPLVEAAAGSKLPNEWRSIDGDQIKQLAANLASQELGSLAQRGAKAAQEQLPAGVAGRARRTCGLLNELGTGSKVCGWVEGASAPGRSATSAVEASAKRWDRIAASMVKADERTQWMDGKGPKEELEQSIRTSAEQRALRSTEDTAQAESGCLVQTGESYEPMEGQLAQRECPGGMMVSSDVACPIATPSHGETQWQASPTDAFYIAGENARAHPASPSGRQAIGARRQHFRMLSGLDAMGQAIAAQKSTATRMEQGHQLAQRLKECEDLLCELRVVADATRLEGEEATVAAFVELSHLDIEVAKAVEQHTMVRY